MASSSSRQVVPSTIPLNKPIALPPLDPTPTKKGAPTPVVYAVRLPDEVANAIMNSQDPTICFGTDTAGVISIPNARDFSFTARPVTDSNNDTARATCFTRRGEALRTVGPIVADLDVNPRLSKQVISVPKKRTLEATSTTKHSEVKTMNEVPPPSSKRARTQKTTAPKRPRRPFGLVSQPMPKLQSQPLTSSSRPGLVSKPLMKTPPDQNDSPTAMPPPPSARSSGPNATNGHSSITRGSLRSAPAPATRSPASPNLSPAGRAAPPGAPQLRSAPPPGSGNGGMQNSRPLLRRSAPVPPTEGGPSGMGQSSIGQNTLTGSVLGPRPSLRMGNGGIGTGGPGGLSPSGPDPNTKHALARSSLSGIQPRKVSPGSLAASLPRPPSRRNGNGHHFSPGGYYTGYSGSPASPRLAANARSDQRIELRRHVIHILGAGGQTLDLLKKRLKIEEGSEVQGLLVGIVRDVADRNEGILSLKDHLWSDLSDNYPGYSDMERAIMRTRRSDMGGGRGGGADYGDGATGYAMSESVLDERLAEFEREERGRHVERVTSEDGEIYLRKRFSKWYPVYRAIVCEMEKMRKVFLNLEKKFSECRAGRERETLLRRIQSSHDKFGERKRQLESALPALHALLKDVKEELQRASKDRP